MKRGKEEEEKKKLEPMFPRLHVNDADKGGGPRAPPRNKMALYEHLTTPSHRFTDHSSSPRHTNTLFPPPPGPSNQPCGVERNLTSQHLDSSASGHVTQMSSMENVTTLAHRRVNASLRQESTSSRLDHETGVMETDDGVESHGNPNDVDDDDDSISSIDVSPDEVVGVLGQKRFWRARKAIAKLIKVQRLIASSSDVLLDEISYLGNVPVKKLLPSEFILKPPPLPQVTKHRSSDSEKTDQNKMESSAENVVGKSSNQGQQHQPSNYMPFASNPPAANGCYYPPQHPPPSGGNQQWLIPVMSPSEGLIYKPHPGPGHTGSPVCGGYYGHFMPAPMIMGSFMDGGPPPFHPGVGNGYFPPYGMMNPYGSGHQQQQQPNEQMNQFVHPVNTQQQSSVNEAISQQQPTQSYPRARKSRQRSTGSSPSGISGTNSFRPLSVVDDDDDDNNEPEQMMTTTTTTTRTTVTQTTRDGGGVTRVIKVVPHNAKLASENAARIFRQQRIFAVQLFELHRLIKVQRLIASSSDVLLDEISYLGNVPVKKLLPSEFIVKPPPLPQVTKHRRCDSEKTDQDKMECSAENVVGKSSNQGQQHQPSNYMPFASNPPAANGCYYPPPSGGNQQWLIPVMSPSEGLIYKPHPGPGHTRPPICGGYYGHFMPAPMIMGSFMDGGPPPFHPGVGNGYFPPYGMMNTYGSGHQQQQQPNEQMNQFVHPGNLQYASAVNSQQQSSVNEAISQQQPTKSYQRARKSRRRSTGSSPSGQEGISGTNSFRPLSVVDDDDDDNNEPEQMMTTTTTTTRTTVTQTTRDGGGVTRVIKVVPHNAKLASENAARIFRSIQEERKHYDSFSNHF
ncbi:hypothetical protein F2Q70_00027903 [Brassica cretica]|uniref:EARLY FLOWERING 3 n=1 Tax=Brassica cretica TaxID=69181 RepID=A0A8S9L540_BRACR|nr:hypothetical protein F2Q70_00027903 [Brassica cretica]